MMFENIIFFVYGASRSYFVNLQTADATNTIVTCGGV